MGLSGLAARGGVQDLEALVADALTRELQQQQLAERTRQANIDNKQRDRQLDLTEKSYKSSIQDRDADNQRADAAARAAADKAAYADTARSNMAELIDHPKDLAAFSVASGQDIPAGVRELVTPKPAKLVPVDVPGPGGKGKVRKMVAEDDPRFAEGMPVYTEPKTGPAPDRQWLMRDGKEVYDTYRPGDTRAGTAGRGSNSTTPEQQAKAQSTMRTVLGKAKELSSKINTGVGPMAKAEGAWRTAKAYVGMDDDVAEYTALLDGAIPFLARAYGHTGVLTQQDVDSVRNSMPKSTDPATLAIRKLKNAEAIMLGLVERAEETIKGGAGAPGDDSGDDVEEWVRTPGGFAPPPRKKK